MIFKNDETGWDAAAIAIALMLAIAPVVLTVYMAHRGNDPAGPDPQHVRGRDMIQFFAGASLLGSEADASKLYDRELFAAQYDRLQTTETGRGFAPTYPPPIYQLFDRLDAVGQMTATRVVLWGFLVSGALGAWLLVRSTGRAGGQALEVALLLFCAPATLMGISTGQPAALWLGLLAAALALWSGERPWLAGAVLGLLCIKPTLAAPVALALVLLGQWAVIAGFLLGGSLLLASSIAVDGLALWTAWLEMMGSAPDLTQQLFVGLDRHASARALLAMPFAGSRAVASVGVLGIGAGLALAIWMRTRLAASLTKQVAPLDAFAILLGAAAFATPHLLDYDLVLYFPLMVWALHRIAEKRAQRPALGVATLAAFYLAPIAYPISGAIQFSVAGLAALLFLLFCLGEVSADRRAEA